MGKQAVMNTGNKYFGSLNNMKSFFAKCLASKKTVILLFALFFLSGVFLFRDYGISPDEDIERYTGLINYVHVMGPAMRASESEAVRATAEHAPKLATHGDRYYGVALQCIMIFIEHLFNFQMALRDIYLMRHAFVFLNYFIAGVCFYLIIKRRFCNGALPLLGALAFILYPRFFGEAFYNIKDSLFFSWMVISGYFALRWLEDRKIKNYFFAAAALAVAINTRILGLSLLLLASAFAVIISIRKNDAFLRAAGQPLALFGLTLVFWVLITPFLWENPVKNIIETFVHFKDFENWTGTHFYMGEMISRHVPWHYIPVWMGITIPIPYIAMFFAGVAVIAVKAAGRLKKEIAMRDEIAAGDVDDELELNDLEALDTGGGEGGFTGAERGAHLYDLFMAALFFCTLFGYIILRITMYEGWRHAYGIYFPFVYIAVYGLGAAITFFKNKHIALRRIGACAIFASFAFLFGWIIVNHPYEYVYFNSIGRMVAERNFALDYWMVSHADLIRYALANDSRPRLVISGFNYHVQILKEDEIERLSWVGRPDSADYRLQDTRVPYDQRKPPEGYVVYASIIVDGMKISMIYKNTTINSMHAEIDPDAENNIIRITSSRDDGDHDALIDGDPATRWTTRWPRQPGDFIMVEFAEPVDYDCFSFGSDDESANDISQEFNVHISPDGIRGMTTPIIAIDGGYRMALETGPYRLIVFESSAASADVWSIGELQFGYIKR